MLHRKDNAGVIAVSQPAHAWVSGQLARHWGNDVFAPVPETVCLAAEQHDIGFLEWERNPTLNPETRLPYTFLEMPRALHLEIWRRSIQQVLQFGRYPGILVSMHYIWLLDRSQNHYPPAEQALIDSFRQEQEHLQVELTNSLREDPYFGPVTGLEDRRHHQQLVSTWDWMSLLLCHGLTERQTVENIPTKAGPRRLTLLPDTPKPGASGVAPWPFRLPQVRLICEGRRLQDGYRDDAHLREALRAEPPETLLFELVPC